MNLNMNPNFKSILLQNKESISIIKKIIESIDTEEEKFFNAVKALCSIVILKKAHEEVGALKKIKSEFSNKKYSQFFKDVKCEYNDDSTTNIHLLDKNDILWSFLINNIGEASLKSVTYKDLNNNVSLIHEKSRSIIFPNQKPEEILFDITKESLDRSQADIVFLTKDINISSFIKHNINEFLLPKLKEISEKKSLLNKVLKK